MGCGCEERREIMFTQGQPDTVCLAIVVAAIVAVTYAYLK